MDEELKQKVMFSAIAFSFVVFVFQIAANSNPFSFAKLMLGVLLAAIVGGITFGVTHYVQNR